MVRTVDYATRTKTILAATINRYIKHAAPVSSSDIARDFDLSSATIRNIFVELEAAGYLTHPHTSAGRIPTQKGYRYYVDFLTLQLELLDEEKNSIVQQYRCELTRLEDALEMTSEVISTITHYASIVSLLDWHDRFFYRGISFVLDQPEFQDTQCIRYLIKLVEDKERLLKIINQDFKGKVHVFIGEELGCSEMDNCAIAVATYSVKNKPLGRMAVLGPARMEYEHIISTLGYVSEVLSDLLK